jgi:hypothetical protein
MSRTAVLTAVASLLACSGFALADSPKLTLDPTVITADAAPSQGLLMQGLDKCGVGKTLADLKLNIYGWVESGYTYDHRHSSYNAPSGAFPDGVTSNGSTKILPGPFNHEFHNHYMLNQFDLRFERQIDGKTFDVGGMIDLMYGSDAARIHARGGWGFDGSDRSDNNDPADANAVNNLDPTWQFDIPQLYVDIGVPVGNGLIVRVGKFYGLMGYEAVDPRGNPFYSHSYLFSATPFTQAGVLASYKFTDQLDAKLGITRGWDIATEDNNGCSIDVIGQINYKLTKQLNLTFNFSTGPENANDSSHYRTVIDPIVYWQVTDALKLGFEALYLYDGGINGNISGFSSGRTHAYGDVWGGALYASYKINDMFTVNGRFEKAHGYLGTFNGTGFTAGDTIPGVSVYEITLGVTITPMPKDPILKGLVVRPEIRYDFTDSTANKFYPANDNYYKDQLTFGCDVIFGF